MSLATLAKRVAAQLKCHDARLVFAESCTAGLLAASLARVPGISEHLCGSAVTYRNDTKHQWLGVSRRLLHSPGPVSEAVAGKMVLGALNWTPEATLGAAVTGHLGPGAPAALDGLIIVALGRRNSKSQATLDNVQRLRLRSRTRLARQREAAESVLSCLLSTLEAE